MITTSSLPATDKQVAFIVKLSAERTMSDTMRHIDGPLTKAQASQIIDMLIAMPRSAPARSVVVRDADAPRQAAPVAAPPVEVGMYRDADGAIYKVQASRESGNLYAKKLTPIGGQRLTETDEVVRWEFAYAPGALRTLTAAQRMSLEEAKAFGIQYGVCCVCGAFLRDATSVAAGIGPVCATKV